MKAAAAEPGISTFGAYIRSLYGENVAKVNVDAGFTCPNRDGTVALGGCVFCNNESFKPGACRPTLPVAVQIENGIRYTRRRYKAEKFLVYFQPYTNTHAPVERLRRLYGEALAIEGVIGLAIGTRPDAVDSDKISLLAELAKDAFILVEYGLQSVHDRTLAAINRGHTYQQFVEAVAMTAGRNIRIGAHLILGLPGESRDEMLHAADMLSAIEPVEFLKLHQLQVIRGTSLAHTYEGKKFPVFGQEEYIRIVCDFLERLSPRIHIQRFFATSPEEILVAPRWSASRHQLLIEIRSEMARRGTRQGFLMAGDRAATAA